MCIGVDLGWYGKPSGVAVMRFAGQGLVLEQLARPEQAAGVLRLIADASGDSDAVVAVDAPLMIPNAAGNRSAEQELNRVFRRYEAGCHPVNAGMAFTPGVLAFAGALAEQGFRHEPSGESRRGGRWMLEVYPHAATIALFGLDKTLKYKRGLRASRARELARLRRLMVSRLSGLAPAVDALALPSIPDRGDLKPVEDRLDAVLCAYMAAYWWRWGAEKCWVFGSNEGGAIVTPKL